ncbi:hypothetical protein ACHAXS_000455 [Conticribra weissflogii]
MANNNTVTSYETNHTEPASWCIFDDLIQYTERFRVISPNRFYSILLGQGAETDEIHFHPTFVDTPLSVDSTISNSDDSKSADNYNEAVNRFLIGNSDANPQEGAENLHESSDDASDIIDEYLSGIKDELDIYWQKGCSFMTRNGDHDVSGNYDL